MKTELESIKLQQDVNRLTLTHKEQGRREFYETLNRMARVKKAAKLLQDICDGKTLVSYPPSQAMLSELAKIIYEETTMIQSFVGRRK